MPLQKQTYRLNMGLGLDTHSDAKVLSSGKMIVLQNAKFTTGNRLSKRDGFAAAAATSNGPAISRLASFNGVAVGQGEVSNLSGSRAFYSQILGSGDSPKFGIVGLSYNDVQVSTSELIANNFTQNIADSASVNGVSVVAWIDATNGNSVNYRAFVQATGAVIVDDQTLSGTGTSVRCTTFGTNVMIAYTQSTTVTVLMYDTTLATGASAPVSYTGLVAGSTLMDVGCIPSFGNTLAYLSGAKQIKLLTISATGSAISSTNITTTNTVIQLCLATSRTASTKIQCVYADSLSLLNLATFNTSLTAALSTVSATNDTTVVSLIAQDFSTGTQVFCGSNTSAAIPKTISTITPWYINTSGTFFVGTKLLGQSIHSKVIYRKDTDLYFWTLFPSETQGQYILMHQGTTTSTTNTALTASARVLAGQAMGTTQGGLCGSPVNVSTISSDVFENSCIVIGKQYAQGGLVQTGAVSKMSLDFNFTNAYSTKEINSQCVIAGGFNAFYDGAYLSELGFFMFPEGYTSSVTTTTGGLLGSGSYQYVATYEWYDHQGNLHRSETGIPLSVTTSTTTAGATITIPTLRVTAKQTSGTLVASPPTIVLYRNTVNASPSIFYRVGSIANNAAVHSVTITDILADSAITANQLLYTTGGVLDNYTIDGTSVICAGPDRLLAADPNNTGIIHVGKPYDQTDGLSFFSGITIIIPTDGGPVTNMQYMDSTLVVFKARMIIAVQGQGPTANGQNNGYSPAQVVSRDVGCDNPHAATLYPDGILFKSAKGYYRLGRDLSFAPASNYIGAGVESFNGSSCLRAMCREDRNEARFLLSDNATILVYNYLFGQWSTIITSATDMTEVNGQFYVSSNTPSIGGRVGQETVGTFTDVLLSPTGIPFLITTGWCALNQLQGCQRVYRVRFLGDSKSTHTLQVEFAYDFEGGDSPTFSETHTITSANITTGGSAWQCEAFPIRQKCESIAIRISDPSPTGESFDITDVELEVGVIPGRRFPLAAGKAF